MLVQKILRFWLTPKNKRFICQSPKCLDSKNVESSGKSSLSSGENSQTTIKHGHKPTDFDKWILTWVKKYPKGQVPDRIPTEVIIQAKSRARIKTANYMTVFALLLCLVTVINVKKDVKKGDSTHKRIEDWHKKVNEEYQAELKAKSSGS